MIGGPAHRGPDLADSGSAGSDAVAEGPGLLEFAEESGTTAQAFELFG